MTHPTIERLQNCIDLVGGSNDQYAEAKAAARVILEAEPSEAEIEAMIDAWNTWRGCPLEDRAKEAIKASNAAKAKEMGL